MPASIAMAQAGLFGKLRSAGTNVAAMQASEMLEK